MERAVVDQSLEALQTGARIQGLVAKAQNGDNNAFALLYKEYVTPLYRYIYFRVGETEQAEDLTQEVFLRALKNIDHYHYKGKPFISWLFRIAHNLIIDYYRRAKKICEPLASQIADEGDDDLAAMVEQNMEMLAIKQAIEKLPPEQKEVISLRFGGELSIAETATAMGKTEGTVKKLQHEALLKLRTLVEK